MDFRDPPIEFPALARSLGVPARQVADPADVVPALREALAGGNGPRLVDVIVEDGFKE